MNVVGIFEAKTKLSKICENVVETGEPSIISKHGKPMVKIVPYIESDKPKSVWDTIEESQERYGPIDEDWEPSNREVNPLHEQGCFDDETDSA